MFKFKCALITVLASLILFSCSKQESDSADGSSIQTLRMGFGAPQTIDQHLMTGQPAFKITAALTEPLLRLNYDTLQMEPAVAKSWQVAEDGLTYTFQLRDNLKWSNGDSLTAEDFVYSWKRILSPALGNQYATDFFAVKNSEAYYSGEIADFSEVGVQALSPLELKISLEKPDPLFLKRLASEITSPVQKATVEKFGDIDDPTNKWILAGNHVGNGPFRLVEWQLNSIIKVEKNPYYWNAEQILLDEVHFYPTETEVNEERLFRAGQIDVSYMGRIPTEKIEYYRQEHPQELKTLVSYATYFYLFNNTKPPFDDVNVRRAFSYAVDRDLIVDKVTKGGEPVANALSPVTENYEPPVFNLSDPDKARKYLAAAGYPNGEGFPTVTLTYNTMDVHRKIAIALQQMWKKELNVDVQIENMEWKVFLDYRQNHSFQLARAGSFSTFLDPADFLDSFVTGHGMNDAGWSNLEYDKIIQQASRTVKQSERFALLKKAEHIMMDQQPIMPLYYYVTNYLISPRVVGFKPDISGQPRFEGVTVKPQG